MRACVRVKTPDGREVELGHGDLIGRVFSAALRLDDARVSEAHALVSLRGDSLKLLALRGVFAVDGKRRHDVVLRPGLRVLLAEDLALDVLSVELPDSVLALRGEGLPDSVLSGLCSLVVEDRPRLEPRYVGAAQAWIWGAGDGWLLQRPGSEPTPLRAGDEFEAAGRQFTAVEVPLTSAAGAATRLGMTAPLRIVAQYDTVQIHREGRSPLVLSSGAAKLISELVALGGPASWAVVAGELWPEESEPQVLRQRLDAVVARLRKRLRKAGIRPDLIRSGGGQLELLLGKDDSVEDKT